MTAPTLVPPARHVREPQFRYLELFGRRIRVAVWHGSAGRVPLLVFNGLGANAELLAPIADCLAETEVITFDAPGIGGSGPARRPYRPWQYALLTTRLLDELGYGRKVDVLGVSWGGAMAQQLAFQARGRVRRLVLAATSAGALMVPGHPSVLLKLASPRRYLDAEYLERHYAALYSEERGNGDHAARMKPPTLPGYLFQLFAGAGWTSAPLLPLIPHETLVLAGRRDRIVPPINGRILASLMPRARLQMVDGGHLFLVSQAAQVMPMIDEFLAAE